MNHSLEDFALELGSAYAAIGTSGVEGALCAVFDDFNFSPNLGNVSIRSSLRSLDALTPRLFEISELSGVGFPLSLQALRAYGRVDPFIFVNCVAASGMSVSGGADGAVNVNDVVSRFKKWRLDVSGSLDRWDASFGAYGNYDVIMGSFRSGLKNFDYALVGLNELAEGSMNVVNKTQQLIISANGFMLASLSGLMDAGVRVRFTRRGFPVLVGVASYIAASSSMGAAVGTYFREVGALDDIAGRQR